MKEKTLPVITKGYQEYTLYKEQIGKIKTFADVPKLDHNPFTVLLGAVIKNRWKVIAAMNNIGAVEYTDPATGEVMAASQNKIIAKKATVDPQKFLKIYAKELKDVFSLSHQAYKVFGYFLNAMQLNKDSDIVYFNIDECMQFCEVNTHPMIYKGLLELIKKFFICRTNRPWAFYINPKYAFNGNRLIIYNEYIKEDYFTAEQAEKGFIQLSSEQINNTENDEDF